MAGAIAAYIAGNYMAYNSNSISSEDFLVLVDQMRTVLINVPQLTNAKKSAKRNFYELMAVGGTFMEIANLDLQKHPNPANSDNLRLVAKDNLEHFLGVNADDIEITTDGLIIF